MNERILELINESTCFKEGDTEGKYDIEVFDKEKFAKLIVRECLSEIKGMMVDKSELLYEHEETTECVNEALMDAHHNISIHFGFAEHFGVEE